MMPITKERLAAVESIIDELAIDLKLIVDTVERSTATTRNHYGDYLTIITGDPDPVKRKLMALALIRAGAHTQGIVDAMRIAGIAP